MNPVGNRAVSSYTNMQPSTESLKGGSRELNAQAKPVEQNRITLSAEGKALLTALQEIDDESKKVATENKTVSEKVESFTHGALGMDHPDKIKEEEDTSYSAGQYLSAALSVGGILLALV